MNSPTITEIIQTKPSKNKEEYNIDISDYDLQYEDTMMEAVGTLVPARRRRVYFIEFEVNGR